MSKGEIKTVWFDGEDGNPHRIEVGKIGITKITKESYSTQPYCGVEYFRAWENENVVADIYNPNQVYYF